MTRQHGEKDKDEDCQWEFVCQRWLSRGDDDKEIVRELLPTQAGQPPEGLLHSGILVFLVCVNSS